MKKKNLTKKLNKIILFIKINFLHFFLNNNKQ